MLAAAFITEYGYTQANTSMHYHQHNQLAPSLCVTFTTSASFFSSVAFWHYIWKMNKT